MFPRAVKVLVSLSKWSAPSVPDFTLVGPGNWTRCPLAKIIGLYSWRLTMGTNHKTQFIIMFPVKHYWLVVEPPL